MLPFVDETVKDLDDDEWRGVNIDIDAREKIALQQSVCPIGVVLSQRKNHQRGDNGDTMITAY